MRAYLSALTLLAMLLLQAQHQPTSPEFLTTEIQQSLVWARYNGSIPSNAVYGGKEANGTKLAVCRCDYNGAKHPGKVVGTGCNIGWGGKEVVMNSFEILTNPNGLTISYQVLTGNTLPARAVSAGREGGNELYVGSAEHAGGMHPGKIFWAGNRYICNFSYGGKEITATGQVKILTAAAPTASTATNTSGGVPNLDGQTFFIECKQSGKYLDVNGGSPNNGTNVIQWTLHRGANQQFTFRKWTEDSYYIECGFKTGRALTIDGASLQDGGNVIQWEFWREPHQIFRLVPAGNGYYFIESAYSGKYLDVAGYSKADGGNIHQWSFHGGDNQQFRLVPVTGGQTSATTNQRPATTGNTTNCQAAAGNFMWFTGNAITLHADGRIAVYKGSALGTWQCESNQASKVRLVWDNGYTDVMDLSQDGQTLIGRNQNNDEVSGRRMSKSEQDAIKIQQQAGDVMNQIQKALKKKD